MTKLKGTKRSRSSSNKFKIMNVNRYRINLNNQNVGIKNIKKKLHNAITIIQDKLLCSNNNQNFRLLKLKSFNVLMNQIKDFLTKKLVRFIRINIIIRSITCREGEERISKNCQCTSVRVGKY